MQDTNSKLSEVKPSLTHTDATKDMGGHNGLPPRVVAQDVFNRIGQDHFEIYVGRTEEQRMEHFQSLVGSLYKFNKSDLTNWSA